MTLQKTNRCHTNRKPTDFKPTDVTQSGYQGLACHHAMATGRRHCQRRCVQRSQSTVYMTWSSVMAVVAAQVAMSSRRDATQLQQTTVQYWATQPNYYNPWCPKLLSTSHTYTMIYQARTAVANLVASWRSAVPKPSGPNDQPILLLLLTVLRM